MLILAVAAHAALNIDACTSAVHGDLISAVTACDSSGVKIDLFDPESPTDACIQAMKAGEQAGKYGPHVPAPTRAGYVREFDRLMGTCKAPKKDDTPTFPTVKLWD